MKLKKVLKIKYEKTCSNCFYTINEVNVDMCNECSDNAVYKGLECVCWKHWRYISRKEFII